MDDSIETNSEISSGAQKRLCWVCFGTEQDDEDKDVVWICPCQCKGSMKWVHEECLQRWIDEKQKRANSLRVTCSQCKTHYILRFPPVNYLIRFLEQYDRFLFNSSPYGAISILLGSVYWCCGSHGFISIIQVMGYEEGRRLVEESDPLLLIIGLPAIPIALILSKLIRWENFILQVWKRSAPKLPRPLYYMIEQPPSRPRANCDQLLVEPGFNEPLACTRMICGALILPTVASLIGKVFFSRFSTSQWRRSLIGGLAFILFKGVIRIYLRKSQYIRYSQRTIRNHNQNAKTNLDNELYSFDHESSGDDIDLQPSSSNTVNHLNNDQLQDDSDDDNQTPRARTMFSMTIRL